MKTRLGNVLYWLGILVGVVFLMGTAYLLLDKAFMGLLLGLLFFSIIGIPSFVAGWVFRYILSGSLSFRLLVSENTPSSPNPIRPKDQPCHF